MACGAEFIKEYTPVKSTEYLGLKDKVQGFKCQKVKSHDADVN